MGEEAPVVGEPAMQDDVAQGSRTEQEVASQPACWRRAGQLAADVAGVLPARGERVAVAGCGTSWFMAQSYAAAREASGHGETDAAERVLAEPLPAEMLAARQFTFLGTGWTYGLANEAALKLREAAGMWTEAYPAMEYRHGPVAVTGEGSIVWLFGTPPDGLGAEIAAAGGLAWFSDEDPLAELVRVQRVAVALARARGLDPDRPRNLARSVILTTG